MEHSVSGTTAQNTENFNFLTTTYSVEQARQDLDEALSEENIIKVFGSSLKPIVNTPQEVEDVRTLKEPVVQELQEVKPIAPVKSITETLEKYYLGSFFENIFVRSKHSPKNIFTTFRKAEGSLILKPKLENWLQWLKDNPDPKGAD